jgi:hypothetical protein
MEEIYRAAIGEEVPKLKTNKSENVVSNGQAGTAAKAPSGKGSGKGKGGKGKSAGGKAQMDGS